MTKLEFINRRTQIISKMLDNPDESGIYPTTVAFAELDDLFDQMSDNFSVVESPAQLLRDEMESKKRLGIGIK